MRKAVLDLGSNSVKYILAEVGRGSVRAIEEKSATTRLAEDLLKRGSLTPRARSETLAVCAKYLKMAVDGGAESVLAVATSAVRDASNGPAFQREFEKTLGVELRVISGSEEGRLIFLGALSDVREAGPHVVMDVGGGSAEWIRGSAGCVADEVSLKLGCVRMTERFLRGDPYDPDGLARLRKHVRHEMRKIASRFRPKNGLLIGTGGSACALALMDMEPEAGPTSAHGVKLSREHVHASTARLARMTQLQRTALPGLAPKRADIVVAGAEAFAAAMDVLKISTLRVSVRGLRYGALLGEPLDLRRAELMEFMRKHEPEPPHVLQVQRLALSLFDQLAGLHRLGPADRRRLEAAALLHDIGWSARPDGRSHHKISARMILRAAWKNWDREDIRLISQIARYHRKQAPSPSHAEFAMLDAGARRSVRRCAALLRIADALDRSHLQRVNSVEAAVRRGALELTLRASPPVPTEILGVAKKDGLFRSAFRLPVRVKTA
ncbi:MAG: Ppx/GppA family phosphatase [Verrucomicrobiae bacterium]|nr:Ppx/GppA family phosphatase [Verrucomicrobiae bacterium]